MEMATTVVDQTSPASAPVAEAGTQGPATFNTQEREPLRVMEHYHRYLYASRFTKGKRVLDIASGEGYGAAFLALNADSVIGIEADASSVQQAAQRYGEFPNLRFETGRYESFKTLEQSFDVAVCFDTLPQIVDSGGKVQFMQLVKKALTPGGIFIVSTPIRSADAQAGNEGEPIPGFSGVELFEFLKQYFQFARFVGQRPLTMSAMWSLHEWKDDLFRFHVREDLFTLSRDVEMFTEPAHIVAVCCDEMLSQDIANGSKSFYFDTKHTERTREIFAEYEEAQRNVAHAQTRNAQLADELEAHRQAVTVLTGENLSHINRIDGLERDFEQQLDAHRQTVSALTSENTAQKSSLEDLQKELDERVARILNFEEESASRAATLEKLQREYDEQTLWADKLATDHEMLSARVRELQSQLEEYSAAAVSGDERNQKLEYDLSALRETIARLELERDTYAGQLAPSASENEHLHARIADLQQQYQELAVSMRSDKVEIERLRGNIATLQALADEKALAAQQATADLNEKCELVAFLELQMQEQAAAAPKAEEIHLLRTKSAEELELLRAESAEEMRLLRAKSEEEMELLRMESAEEIERARRQHAEAMEALAKRSAELEEAIAGHAAAAAQAAEENQQLRAGIEEIKARTAENERKAAEHDALVSGMTQENQKLRARAHELQKQFDERSGHARTMTLENEKLQARVASLQKGVEEKSAMIILLNQEIDGAKQKIETMQRDFEQKLQQGHQWEKENKKRLDHVNDVQRKCDEQSFTMRQMKIDFEKQAAAFDTFQKSQGDLQQRYNKSQIKVQELTQEVAILEQKVAAVRSSGPYKLLASLGLLPKA